MVIIKILFLNGSMTQENTHYAPASRSNYDEIKRQSSYFCEDCELTELLDFIPSYLMVLNQNRQLVYGNQKLLDYLSLSDSDTILGQRPGEILQCVNHKKNQNGCGTTQFCKYCGAAQSIVQSVTDEHKTAECRIVRSLNGNEEPLDLRVWAYPFKKYDEPFTFFYLFNIEDEKRRLFLERSFLHDISNTTSALLGLSDLIKHLQLPPNEKENIVNRINILGKRMSAEIHAHRLLIAAEYNELQLEISQINSLDLLELIRTGYNNPERLNGRFLKIDEGAMPVTFETDITLLSRILENMVKNGIEASPPNHAITIGCYGGEDRVFLWVHSPTYMPENIRLQIFNRSFSTKKDLEEDLVRTV